MSKTGIIGLILLAVIWLWLAWVVLSSKEITLYTILIVAASGIIVFVPLWRKLKKK